MNTLIESFIEHRNWIIEELFLSVKTKYDKLKLLKDIQECNMLDYGDSVKESPKCLHGYLVKSNLIPKNQQFTFLELAEKVNNVDFLIDDIYEYVKNNRIIGTKNKYE